MKGSGQSLPAGDRQSGPNQCRFKSKCTQADVTKKLDKQRCLGTESTRSPNGCNVDIVCLSAKITVFDAGNALTVYMLPVDPTMSISSLGEASVSERVRFRTIILAN